MDRAMMAGRVGVSLRIALLFLCLCLLPSLSRAQAGKSGPGWGVRNWRGDAQCLSASELNLVPEQARAIDLLRQSSLREMASLRAQIFAKRLELREFLTNPAVKTETLRSTQSAISEIETRLNEKGLDYLVRVRALLTPEQLRLWCPEKEYPFIHGMMTQRPWMMGPARPGRPPSTEENRKED
jgi:Spy/CpxP family protein refolding chaperone